jgi:cysteinyl-tRNA synthetase
MVWDSPWGMGFPGWHIECSAMSLEFLGSDIDIHVGGIDLRFPHHENERAQSNAVIGKEAVDLWVHGEHLLFEGRKMSKSSGNVVLVEDLLSKGIDPLALRLCFLENRYRSQMDLTWNSLQVADETLKRWRTKMSEWGTSNDAIPDKEIADLERELLGVINSIGVGPQGLGGATTSFAVHIEFAATHISMNPVAVSIQCWRGERASATINKAGDIKYGY